MLISSNDLQNLPVVGIQTGGRLATLGEAIIDPRQLKVVAFYCKGLRLNGDGAVLHTEDIREVGDMGAIINSADNIMSPDDLVRLKEVIGYKFQLEGKEVVDDTGRKVGRVTTYNVETNSFYVIKLHVRPGIFKALQTSEVIIDRSQIVELSPKRIVIKAPAVKEEASAAMESLPAVDNPFRRSPQPDTATTKEPT